MLIDSHCHLDFPELAGDEAGVLARARTAGPRLTVSVLTIVTARIEAAITSPSRKYR